MAELTIVLPNTHEEIPLSEVDFSQVTNTELINQLIASGNVPAPATGTNYELVIPGSGTALGLETKTLEELGVKDGEKIKLLASGQNAAELTIVLPNTHEEIPLSEVDFSQVTNTELINQLIASGNVPAPAAGTNYELVIPGSGTALGLETKTLEELGVKDGEKIKLLASGQNAAELIIVLPNTHEEIPLSEVDFSQVTNTELINQLIASGNVPAPAAGTNYELVIPGSGTALGLETKTLEELGVKDGEKIKLLASGQNAAELTIVLPNTHEEIPLSEVDFSQVTNTELINQLIASGNVPDPRAGTNYLFVIPSSGTVLDLETKTLEELGVKDGEKIKLLASSQNAAELTIVLPNTHEEIPLSEVDFSQVTNTELINQLIASGNVPAPAVGTNYELVIPGSGTALGLETKTLEELGVKDGEKIKLLASGQNAAELTIVLPNTHEEIPLSEVDFSQVTNTELINQLIASGNVPAPAAGTNYELVIPGSGTALGLETKTLEELGVKDGEKIKLLASGQNASTDIYEIRLEEEFRLLTKLQRHPNVSKYLQIFYKERMGGSAYKSILEPIESAGRTEQGTPITLHPNKFKFTYTMPMYVGEGQLINDWSASFLFEVPESVLMNQNKSLKMSIEGGEFPDGRVPFNNHVSKTWVCTGTIWDIAQGSGLWYFVMSVGCLLNQDRIVTPADDRDENRHLNSAAFRFWKRDRNMAPITDIKWPFNLDSEVIVVGGGTTPKKGFVIGSKQSQSTTTSTSSFNIGAKRTSENTSTQETTTTSRFTIGTRRTIEE